jgi:hypothetical protein
VKTLYKLDLFRPDTAFLHMRLLARRTLVSEIGLFRSLLSGHLELGDGWLRIPTEVPCSTSASPASSPVLRTISERGWRPFLVLSDLMLGMLLAIRTKPLGQLRLLHTP